MYSRRAIVLAVLIGLAFIASTTNPWIHGGRLLASKYAGEFFTDFGYGGSSKAVDDSFHKEFDAAGIRSVRVEAQPGDITVTRADDDRISINGERVAYGPSPLMLILSSSTVSGSRTAPRTRSPRSAYATCA